MGIRINGKEIRPFCFKGGECHLNIDDFSISNATEIYAELYNSDDIMSLLLTVNAVKHKNINTQIDLVIPYMPYARQDRVCSAGDPFSLQVFANVLQSTSYNSITVYDPHSDVVTNLFRDCRVVSQLEILQNSFLWKLMKDEQFLLVAPDKGALDKVSQIAKLLCSDMVVCNKIRDPSNGTVQLISLVDKFSHDRDKAIILDDICDGGATFIETAKLLKTKGVKEIYLYITHGIFSKGFDQLRQYFKHIYCYHYFHHISQIDTDFITIVKELDNEN